jgi:hypothetical protein
LSERSSQLVILAAARPQTPNTPVTSTIVNTDVKIKWSSNYDGGSPLTSYSIVILQFDNVTFS